MASNYDDAFLNGMKTSGDPLADGVIQSFAGNGGAGGINVILDQLRGAGGNPDVAPPALREYLEKSSRLPEWADEAQILRAQQYFTLHGPLFGVVLLYKALPVLYAGGMGGAQVLAMTGRLTNHYRQRASETLRFILDVMKPGGLAPGGRGIATAQKVRLMHAAIRCYAQNSPPFKAHPQWGLPINQEELAGTLLAFSSVTLDGLASLGLTAPKEEAEAYMHVWKVVGHILGIDPRLMVKDMGEARKAWMTVIRRNFLRTDEGILLMKDHMAFLDGLVPGDLLDRGNNSIVRYLIGRRITNRCFDLPRGARLEILLHLLRSFLGLEKLGYLLFPGLAKAARRLSVRLMESLQAYWSDGQSRPFRVPAAIREA